MGSTYALDWSVENVGPTIKYDSDPRLFQLDYAVKPPGATASVGWMPNAQNSINNGFELPVTLDAGGTVSFYKYVSSETNYDGLRFYVDGVQQGFWSGPAGSWAQVSFSLTAGVHTLRWAYTKDTSGSAGSDRAYVALLEVTNVATLPTSRRVSKVYDFENGVLPAPVNTASWTNSTSSPITGTRSLRSPASTTPNSTYSATIAVPGNAENTAVGFDFKRSAESGDRTWFVMDGVDFPVFYGEAALQQKMGFIIAGGSGAHTLRVDYRTDATLTQGENATWIDNLSVPLKVRTNLFPYPSGEAALGWAPWPGDTGTTVAADASVAYVGAKGIRFSRNTSTGRIFGVFGSDANSNPTGDSFAVVAGDTYTFSMYVHGQSTAPSIKMNMVWQTATGYQAFVTTTTATSSSGWTRCVVTGTVPAGAVKMGLEIQSSTATVLAGDSFVADGFMLEKGSTAGTYFDGSTVKAGYDYAWTGTTNASSSTETANPEARTNLITNPSFEVDNAGWPSFTRKQTPSTWIFSGSWYVTGNGADAFSPKVPATAGLDYTASGYFTNDFGSRTAGVTVRFYDSANTELSAPTPTLTALNTINVPQRRSATRTAPAGTTQVAMGVHASSSTVGFDAFMLEQSSTLGDYFDGSSAKAGYTYAWSGNAHASNSIEVPPAAVAGAKTIASALSGAGTLSSSLAYSKRINSALSGSGSLTSALAYTKRINSALSGTGTLSAKLRRNIASTLSGSGTLTSVLSGRLIKSNLSGSGTLTSALRRTIQSALSGSGSLTSSLAYAKRMESAFSGSGTLSSVIEAVPTKQISSAFGGEGVLFSELGHVAKPGELGTGPLGKLSSFTVSTSAVQLNPSEGSGSTPSINATYTNGVDPEYALGETNVLKNGAIGTYEGEVVKVGTSQSSGRASISMNTALTPLNVELHLFPFIDGVPGLGTAARAIDYWTQQCGLFYDKVPGQCVAYASGFGHVDAFGAGTTARFYERLTGGTTTTRVVNGRSVRTLGAAVTGTTKFHEAKDETVRVTLPKNRKLVFSTGLGLSGSGRMGTVEWSFLDPKDVRRTVTLTGTSDGGVSASIDGTTAFSASVPAGGSYRLAFSLERVSTTALVGKLTVHTDDLAGSGDLVYASSATVIDMELSSILRLTSITHSSAGGAGTEMTRWGTYLTVADLHPMEVPAIQKVLGQSKKPFEFVSGFTGNVWNLLNEFCSIARLEVRFIDGALHVEPRSNAIVTPGTSWALFDVDRQRREKYKQVAVVNKQSKAVTTDDAVLWRADSVYQVAAREVFETTVQTGHSILNVVNPVAVSGITPFPYKKGAGQYVVTGADGYIIAPAWWNDNGGKVEVSLTGVEGEIAIKITAPALETVRAPYRISEGEADRPALYVSGSGILNDPTEVHVSTGAKNAREGFDNVFESPFIAGVRETYDTAAAMAHQYSASVAEVQYELPNSFETPTGLGQFPAGVLVTDNLRNYRIQDASQTHSKVSGNAVAYTTIGAYVASYPAGATLRDEKARHAGRTIRKFNIKPLKGDA